MKKLLVIAFLITAVLAVSMTVLRKSDHAIVPLATASVKNDEIVSKSGIHWHPTLKIYIKGRQQVIPANIGIGASYASSKWYDPMMSMTDFHTHDSSGQLHWEVMDGPVTKDHVRLKAFFEVWGKAFSKNQILSSVNGPGGTVKMSVNGQPNTDYEQYVVRDKDAIEIRYE